MPRRNTLRFSNLVGAGREVEVLRNVLSSIEGVRIYERAYQGVDEQLSRATDGGGQLLCVRALGDTWSRSARRKRNKQAHLSSSHGGGGSGGRLLDAQQSSPVHDIISSGLVCFICWKDNELEFQWVYGHDRALFESFASHVSRKVVGAVLGDQLALRT
jgi:hypothetical protein